MGLWAWFKNSQRPRAARTANGVSLQTHLSATYPELVRVLGAPNAPADDYKTTAEWHIDGGRVRIYDWKATSQYDPELPSAAKLRSRRYNWHVGTDGSDEANAEVTRVRAALRQARV